MCYHSNCLARPTSIRQSRARSTSRHSFLNNRWAKSKCPQSCIWCYLRMWLCVVVREWGQGTTLCRHKESGLDQKMSLSRRVPNSVSVSSISGSPQKPHQPQVVKTFSGLLLKIGRFYTEVNISQHAWLRFVCVYKETGSEWGNYHRHKKKSIFI